MSAASAPASAASASALLGGCTSPSDSAFFLTSTPVYRVHPLVVFSILDHYQRRNDGQTRVVGTLIGERHESGVIEVKQSFPVPHTEEEEAASIEIDHHRSMVQLYKQVYPNDVVVGWYSTAGATESPAPGHAAPTAEQLQYITSLMHEVYRSQLMGAASAAIEPLHLEVDVSMKGGMKIAGFVNQVVRAKPAAQAPAASPAAAAGTGAAAAAAAASAAAASAPAPVDVLSSFHPVPVELHMSDEERLGIDALISGVPEDINRLDAPATLLSDSENIEQAVVKLLECMESVEAYIARVVAGKVAQPDASLALAVHQLLASMPTMEQSTFRNVFATHIQDLLSIVYLANITKNQLAIADKANMLL